MPRMSGSSRGGVDGMEEWTPGGDPMLALLPAERPWAFDALPFDEQQWRARVFLMVWIQSGSSSGSMIYSWAKALEKHDDDAERKAWVTEVLSDAVIIDGLQSRQQPEAHLA